MTTNTNSTTILARLTPEEWDMIQQLRQEEPAEPVPPSDDYEYLAPDEKALLNNIRLMILRAASLGAANGKKVMIERYGLTTG